MCLLLLYPHGNSMFWKHTFVIYYRRICALYWKRFTHSWWIQWFWFGSVNVFGFSVFPISVKPKRRERRKNKKPTTSFSERNNKSFYFVSNNTAAQIQNNAPIWLSEWFCFIALAMAHHHHRRRRHRPNAKQIFSFNRNSYTTMQWAGAKQYISIFLVQCNKLCAFGCVFVFHKLFDIEIGLQFYQESWNWLKDHVFPLCGCLFLFFMVAVCANWSNKKFDNAQENCMKC